MTDGVGLVEATHNFDVSVNTLFYEVNAQFQIFGLDSDKCRELGLLGIQRTVFIFESDIRIIEIKNGLRKVDMS